MSVMLYTTFIRGQPVVALDCLHTGVILASASSGRRKLLEQAGVSFDVAVPNIDEQAVRNNLEAADTTTRNIALELAERKALRISETRTDALVIGADSTIECDGIRLDKAIDIVQARERLEYLSGRTHELVTAAAIARNSVTLWRHVSVARMTMRHLSDQYLDDYLARTGEKICRSVGCYEIEGPGIQLFERMEGDYFSIVGLPLLAVLQGLREWGGLGS